MRPGVIGAIAFLLVACTSTAPPVPSGSAAPAPGTASAAPVRTSSLAPSAGPTPVDVPPEDDLGVDAFATLSHWVRSFSDDPGPEDAKPLSATITYDDEATVRTVIPRSGGLIAATGVDGTTYSLSIPGTALLTDTELSMTPIATVSTPAAGGELVRWEGHLGVRIEPSGLFFLDTAELVLTPANPIGDPRASASSGDGAGIHPYPILPSGGIALPIVHLSEFIVIDGIVLPVEVPSSIPAGAQAQLERDIAATYEDGEATPEEARSVRDKYWPYVEAILERSSTDCAFAESGQLGRAGGIMTMLSTMGFDAEGDVAEFQTGLLVAIENCIREVTEERCFDPNNKSHVLRLIGLVRQAELLGPPYDPYAIVSEALAGNVPGTALCGDVVGLVSWENITRGDGGSDDMMIVDQEAGMIEVNLVRDAGGFVDDGSRYSYVYRNTVTITGEAQCTGTIITAGEGRGSITDAGGIVSLGIVEPPGVSFLGATGTGAGQTVSPDPVCGQSGPHERTFGASCPGTGATQGIEGLMAPDGALVTIACSAVTMNLAGFTDAAYASGHLTIRPAD